MGPGPSPPVTGMLDAYVDQQLDESPKGDDGGKPVSKKNKNKKKREQREAEEKRRQSESNSNPPDGADDQDEVIDSWEEISAADAPALPKSALKIETPPKKVETPPKKAESPPKKVDNPPKKAESPPKKVEYPVKKSEKPNKSTADKGAEAITEKLAEMSLEVKSPRPTFQTNEITLQSLAALEATMREVSELFKNPPAQTAVVKKSSPEPNKNVIEAQSSSANQEEKSRDEIKAEREAKKQAKANAKAKPKEEKPEGNNDQPAPTDVDEKSRDEIKAEREAKKLAKQAAKQAAKGNPKGEEESCSKPEVDVAKPQNESEPVSGKSKAELKAERRAKQEAQRAAKEQQKNPEPKVPSSTEAPKPKPVIQAANATASSAKQNLVKSQRVSDDIQADRPSIEKKRQRQLAAQQIPPRTKAQKKVLLFKHLHQYERELSVTRGYPIVGAHIHPSVLQLGLQYAEGTIQGSNARCIALLHALKKVIEDFETPPEKEFSRDLDAKLKLYISFLKECRPHSVSMGNAIRTIKSKINSLESGIPESEAKEILCEAIDLFRQNVKLAPKAIYKFAEEKIKNGDVILTYGCSSLLRDVLLQASANGQKFRVVVADSRPKLEGREMIRHLVIPGIHCTYLHISSIPYIIKEVTKVFLGAHAVLANGFVMSRVGTAQVALIAKAHNVPVMVCCETYKFSDRVQTDSFVFNELGDPDDLVATGSKVNPLEDWRDLRHLCLLNLTYDFTPASLVDAIISEISVIPCTSVPVVLRLKKDDLS